MMLASEVSRRCRGCDSVLAETGGATSVNFDEVAVYRNGAILPRYLVVYKYDPPS